MNGLVEDAGRGGLLVPEPALSPEFDRDLSLLELFSHLGSPGMKGNETLNSKYQYVAVIHNIIRYSLPHQTIQMIFFPISEDILPHIRRHFPAYHTTQKIFSPTPSYTDDILSHTKLYR